jgi:hypothetical protein
MIPKYVEEPEKEPKKGWYCEHCGRALPRYGVWAWRHQNYINRYRNGIRSRGGYYCDSCADAREQGADF